ncbi:MULTISPECIES: hypothetical protein [unclassified Paenibacillus]|uniref:hypothetical protein n=1 Tax=unclassified Paenibacillus TaxID=185978 RepID=UPI00363695B8
MQVDWGTVIISVPSTLIIAGGFAKLYLNSFIDNRFKEKIESHKSELQLLLENNKFDLQRKMADFNLYTNKRHEAYMNVYDLILKADGHIRGLMGFKTLPDYSEYGLLDIEKRLRNYNLLEKVIEDFLGKWSTCIGDERQYLYKEINEYLSMIEVTKAKVQLTEANNYFLFNKLYLSDEVQEILSSLITLLSNFSIGAQFLLENDVPFKDATVLRAHIENYLNKLQKQMRVELQIGYYQ